MDDLFEGANFVGNTTEIKQVGEPEVTEEDIKEATAEETKEENEEEAEQETEEETVEEEETPKEEPKKDGKIQALDSERARRKQAEKELRELKAKLEAEKNQKEDEERLAKERENLKQELLKGDLVDEEVAEKLIDTFGDRLLKNQIANERKGAEADFEKKFSEFVSGDFYKDAEVYKPEIKELMAKGLTMEQAYRAAIPEGRFEQMKKDMKIEAEQKLLYSQEKADKVDVGHAETQGELKRTAYTKKEQEIARESGMDIKEVHKRSKMFTLDEILDL